MLLGSWRVLPEAVSSVDVVAAVVTAALHQATFLSSCTESNATAATAQGFPMKEVSVEEWQAILRSAPLYNPLYALKQGLADGLGGGRPPLDSKMTQVTLQLGSALEFESSAWDKLLAWLLEWHPLLRRP